MPEDNLSEYIAFEALNVASEDFEICSACQIGILINVDSEASERLVCDMCNVEFIISYDD